MLDLLLQRLALLHCRRHRLPLLLQLVPDERVPVVQLAELALRRTASPQIARSRWFVVVWAEPCRRRP